VGYGYLEWQMMKNDMNDDETPKNMYKFNPIDEEEQEW